MKTATFRFMRFWAMLGVFSLVSECHAKEAKEESAACKLDYCPNPHNTVEDIVLAEPKEVDLDRNEMSPNNRRSLATWVVVEEGCDYELANGWNTYIDGGCCNEANCPYGRVPDCSESYHACDQSLRVDYYGPGQDYKYCQCACKPGLFYDAAPKTECCGAWSRTCDSLELCEVEPNFVAYCKDAWIRVALIERLTGMSENGETEEWKAVLAAAALAVKHFNERNSKFTPALESIQDCKLQMKVTGVIDTASDPLQAVPSIVNALQGKNLFVVGPPDDDLAQATSFVAQSYNVPMVSYNFGSHVSSGSSLQSSTFIQASVASEEVGVAMCKYVKEVLKYDSVIVLEQRDDRKAMSLITNLKVACQRVKVDVNLFSLPEERVFTQNELEEVLLAANATRINGVIFPVSDKINLLDQTLHTAFNVGLLRENTVWIFSNEDVLNSFDSYTVSLRRVLHGSTLIQAGGARLAEDELFHHFAGSWSSFTAQDVADNLPSASTSATSFTDEFFQTFDAYTSEKLRTYGALQYDMITAFGLLTCMLQSEKPYIYPRTTFRNSLLQNLHQLDFEGLTGRVKFDTTKNTRDKAQSRVFVSNLLTADEALEPTAVPTTSPSFSPTLHPTKVPTESPTISVAPTQSPTDGPTIFSTSSPSTSPTISPSNSPSTSPTISPTNSPSTSPTNSPSTSPTTSPTNSPSTSPTTSPTNSPSTSPTTSPTGSPSTSPTNSPTMSPTNSPTTSPTNSPSPFPTGTPTTAAPTSSPTTAAPSKTPTKSPTQSPTSRPTRSPTPQPTDLPERTGFHVSHVARFDLVTERFSFFAESGVGPGQVFNGGVQAVPPNLVERQADLLRVGVMHPLVSQGKIVDPFKCFMEMLEFANDDSEHEERCYSQGEYLATLAGVLLGIEDFNARNPSFAPKLESLECNKKITMTFADTEASDDTTLVKSIALLDQDPVDMLIGPFAFSTSITAAALASVYNTPVVSYTSTSSALSDGGKIVRLNVAQEDVVKSVCRFWSDKKFKVAAVIGPANAYGDALRRDLRNACSQRNIDIEVTFILYDLDGSTDEAVEKTISALFEAKRNIVLIAGQDASSVKEREFFTALLDEAHKKSLLGTGTSWSFLDWYAPRYMENCRDDTKKSLHGSLFFGGMQQSTNSTAFQAALASMMDSLPDKLTFASSTTRKNFEQVVALHKNQTVSALELEGQESLALLAYDAAMVTGMVACAISPEVALNPDQLMKQVFATLPTSNFQGATGLVGFQTSGARRKGSLKIVVNNWELVKGNQACGDDGTTCFSPRLLYTFDSEKGSLLHSGGNVLYNGGEEQAPLDIPERPATLLRMGFLQRMTDRSIKEATSCTNDIGGRWENSFCFQDDGWRAAFAASLLAVKHFNEKNSMFVEEFNSKTNGCEKVISLSVQDSGADRGTVLDAMQTFSREEVDVVIGPYDDDLTTTAALLGSIYRVPQVSHGATSAGLNNKEKYPFFSRVVPSDAASALALCFDWSALGYEYANVLYVDNGYGRSFAASLSEQCSPLGIDLLLVPFKVNPLKLDTTTLVRSKVNVLVLVAKAEAEIPQVLQELFDKSLLGIGKQLYLSSESSVTFLHTAEEEVRKVVNGSRLVLAVGGSEENPIFAKFLEHWSSQDVGGLAHFAPSGFSVEDTFFEKFDKHRFKRSLAQVAAYHYDAVALAALTACRVAPKEKVDKNSFADEFMAQAKEVEFKGLTGDLKFDSKGDRNASTSVFELYNIKIGGSARLLSMADELQIAAMEEEGTELVLIGTFLPATRQFVYNCSSCSEGFFNGGLTTPPQNIEEIQVDMKSEIAVKRLCRAMAGLSILCCILSCIWIIIFRHNKVIKASQKPFLFLFIFGKVLSSASIVPLTLDDLDLGKEGASVACMSTLWLYSVGFFLSFATLFEKNKRAYKIFTVTFKVTDNRFSDKVLLRKICYYLLADIAILLVYTMVSPEHYARDTVLRDENGRELASAGYCTSERMGLFYAIFGVYHTGILLYGSYISYLAKDINSAFSEAKYISTALFSMLQVWMLAIPLSIVVANDPVSFMFVRSGVTFVSDIVTLSLVVGSKFIFVHISAATDGIGGNLVQKWENTKTKTKTNLTNKVYDHSTLIGTQFESIPTASILSND